MRHPGIVLAFALVSAPAPLSSQTVIGRVLDATAGTPVLAASVALVDSAGGDVAGALTDSAGTFFVRAAKPGTYSFRVERVGYARQATEPFGMVQGEEVHLTIELGVLAVELTPLRVTERYEGRAWLGEFYGRMHGEGRAGVGRFIARDRLERAVSLVSVLVMVPRLHTTADHTGDRHVVIGSGWRTCVPAIYLNGLRVSDQRFRVPIDRIVSVQELEGIEIYRSAHELPPAYHRPGDCGAILAWTRADIDPSGEQSLRKLLIGVGGLLALFVLGLTG